MSFKGSNLQLIYDENPSMTQIIQIGSIIVSGLTLVVFLFLVTMEQKLAATELLLSAQMVYLACFSAGNNIGLTGLIGLKYLAGYNDLASFSIN